MSVPTKNIKKWHPGFEPATKEYQRLLVCHDHCHITAYIARHGLLDGIQWAHHLIHVFAPLRQRSLVGTWHLDPVGDLPGTIKIPCLKTHQGGLHGVQPIPHSGASASSLAFCFACNFSSTRQWPKMDHFYVIYKQLGMPQTFRP